MNYRHAYHAGNFADALKHVALCELLRLLTTKDKPLFVLDTHAGAGGYSLSAPEALRTRESEAGIARLVEAARRGAPGAAARYLATVMAYDRKFGAHTGPPHRYPGSPRLVRAGLRSMDRFVACELHAEDSLALKREFAGDRMIEVRQADGYQALKALLPPPERRGLVLMDPPFEADDEFERLARAMGHGLRRFATGCYALWYPLKDGADVRSFVESLGATRILLLELGLGSPVPEGKLKACALAVINPPWRFEEAMREALPWMAAALGEGAWAKIDASPATAPVPVREA